MTGLGVALAICLVALGLAFVCLVTLLVTEMVQGHRDARFSLAMRQSQHDARAGTPTAPVGLVGRMDAFVTGQIPIQRPVARGNQGGQTGLSENP